MSGAFGSGIQAGVGLLLGQKADKEAYNKQLEAYQQQQKNITMQANYAVMNYNIEKERALAQVANDLFETRQQTSSQIANVDNAVLQEVGYGRTAQSLMNATRTQQALTLDSQKERLENTLTTLDLNKEQAVRSANNQLQSLSVPQYTKYGLNSFIDTYTNYLKLEDSRKHRDFLKRQGENGGGA